MLSLVDKWEWMMYFSVSDTFISCLCIFQFYDIQNIALGTFGFPVTKNRSAPMIMCKYKYTNSSVDPEEESYDLNRQTDYCIFWNLVI